MCQDSSVSIAAPVEEVTAPAEHGRNGTDEESRSSWWQLCGLRRMAAPGGYVQRPAVGKQKGRRRWMG